MKKADKIISKSKLFLKRHPQYQKALIIVFILIVGFVLFLVISGSRLPNQVWLPNSSQYVSGERAMSNLPVKGESVITKYGRAIRYTTAADWPTEKDSKPWITIYEFRTSILLKPSACPNITNTETLVLSDCENLGTFQEQPVYAINRSKASGTTEYYLKLGDTFIYIKAGGDGNQSLDYVNTFTTMSRGEIAAYLADNNKQVSRIQAKQKAEKEATDKNNALAYTRLDFTPAIPTNLPSGWQLNTKARAKPIQIDGPDANHPNMVNLDYMDDGEGFMSVHSGKLSNFIVGTQCGPSPGHLMENLDCHKVAGTDYYEATLYSERDIFVRYLYRPVGDSLVITSIAVFPKDNKRPSFPKELAKIQDRITLSAQPSSMDSLKGSTYNKLFY